MVSSIKESGWPSLGIYLTLFLVLLLLTPSLAQLKGKFMLVLSGNETWKSYYANNLTETSLLFSDQEFPDNDTSLVPPTSGNRIVFNFHLYTKDFAVWNVTIPRFRQANFLTRGYTVNGEDLWVKSLQVRRTHHHNNR